MQFTKEIGKVVSEMAKVGSNGQTVPPMKVLGNWAMHMAKACS